MKNIQNNDLKDFCEWYKHRYNECCVRESVFVTCMCGHFHSHEHEMKRALKWMLSLGLIIQHNDETITIL